MCQVYGIHLVDRIACDDQLFRSTRLALHPATSGGTLARPQVAEAVRSIIAFGPIATVDPALLLRAIEVYEVDRLDFAEAYLVANAETTGVGRIASFDTSIDRVTTVERVDPTRR